MGTNNRDYDAESTNTDTTDKPTKSNLNPGGESGDLNNYTSDEDSTLQRHCIPTTKKICDAV